MTANDTTSPAAAADSTSLNQTLDGNDKKAATSHPLGPLTAAEITQSSSLIQAQWPEGTRFQFKVITLLEPLKAELVPYLDAEKAGQSPKPIDRKSQVVYYLRNTVSPGLLDGEYWGKAKQASRPGSKSDSMANQRSRTNSMKLSLTSRATKWRAMPASAHLSMLLAMAKRSWPLRRPCSRTLACELRSRS